MQDGGVRFRLWAPGAAPDVAGARGRSGDAIPMVAQADGWFELTHAPTRMPAAAITSSSTTARRCPTRPRAFSPRTCTARAWWSTRAPITGSTPTGAGRPWDETVLYELHVGTFTAEGTFDGLRRKLDHLAELGVTAIELMPVADFPGSRNWGYDGVLPFAPGCQLRHARTSSSALVDAAHGRGLMVFLDVVYNHFGPDGNYLQPVRPELLRSGRAHALGRGDQLHGQRRGARLLRSTTRSTGSRSTASTACASMPSTRSSTRASRTSWTRSRRPCAQLPAGAPRPSGPRERRQRRAPARAHGDGRPVFYDAQWNDDIHHVCHHLLTGEAGGYYARLRHRAAASCWRGR